MPITAFYASLLIPLYLFLSFRVISFRRSGKIEIGDGSDREMLRRMRVHANFSEYVPVTLVVMALAESLLAPSLVLHGCGIALVLGRYLHAYALSQEPHILGMRVTGMVLTLNALGVLAIVCLVLSLGRLMA